MGLNAPTLHKAKTVIVSNKILFSFVFIYFQVKTYAKAFVEQKNIRILIYVKVLTYIKMLTTF